MDELKQKVHDLEQTLKEKMSEISQLRSQIETLNTRRGNHTRKLVIDKVTVDPVEDEKYPQVPHIVFYKERDFRMIKVQVSLQNEDGDVVEGETIPLKSELWYQNRTPVPTKKVIHKPKKNQRKAQERDVLTLHHSHLQIDTDGKVTLNFRIEITSQHHDYQLFLINLSSYDPDLLVTPVQIGPIEVKTKHPNDRSPRKEHKADAPAQRKRNQVAANLPCSPSTKKRHDSGHCNCPVCREAGYGVCERTGFQNYDTGINDYVFSPQQTENSPSSSTPIDDLYQTDFNLKVNESDKSDCGNFDSILDFLIADQPTEVEDESEHLKFQLLLESVTSI